MLRALAATTLTFGALLAGCSPAPDPLDADHVCDGEQPTATIAEALSPIDCTESQDTGYTSGTPFPITVVTVDGKKVEKDTANAYYVMAQAADKAGITLKISSGFRTNAEQQYFYNCYINCNCNNCNLAAKPGYSNHQSGHALDLNTSSPGVLTWLNNNGATYGFKRTVPSEAWHWEWWSGGPGGGPCGKPAYSGKSLGLAGQSYPVSSAGAVTVEVGQTVTGWIKLENVGTASWKSGVVKLAPMPRDAASPFASPSWLSPHRISTPAADLAPGQVGEFALDITGSVLGQSSLKLGWLAEGITWFADAPQGGGPPDGYFEVLVNVVPSTAGSGGNPGSGGSAGSAGSPGSGGSPGAGGGWSDGGIIPGGGAGGSAGSGKTQLLSSGDDGSCSVTARAAGRSSSGLLALALFAAAGALRRRRRSLRQ